MAFDFKKEYRAFYLPKNKPELVTVALMDRFLAERGYENDLGPGRLHHEIYLSDARKVPPEKWKTVIRHPIRKKA